MTKNQALLCFTVEIRPNVDPADKPAIREAWNNFTDMLQKSGEITQRQYDTWSGPKEGK